MTLIQPVLSAKTLPLLIGIGSKWTNVVQLDAGSYEFITEHTVSILLIVWHKCIVKLFVFSHEYTIQGIVSVYRMDSSTL